MSVPTRKRTTKRREGGKKAPAPRAARAPAAGKAARPINSVAAPFDEAPFPADLATIHVEPVFAKRVAPEPPERPFPSARRAIFFDVENTSRAAHIARVLDHLAVDRAGQRTDFVAVGNWRVIGHDTARLLARHGAHLVHSAPSVGVRDWSDLRIAVAAGVWLASARPGDAIEIVSDDRAFDAVGDVSASLGIAFRRLSFRVLAGEAARPDDVVERAPREQTTGRGRHPRRGHRGGWRDRPAPARPAPAARAAQPPARGHAAGPLPDEPHTAPHDELVTIVQDLIQAAPGRVVTIDTLANALKARGFSRPAGSPRLGTRLRRIKELTVSRSGAITLTRDGGEHAMQGPAQAEDPGRRVAHLAKGNAQPFDSGEDLSTGPGNQAPSEGGTAGRTEAGPAVAGVRRGRRSRRGGRRHRQRGTGAPASTP
jgi:hypothetical protein